MAWAEETLHMTSGTEGMIREDGMFSPNFIWVVIPGSNEMGVWYTEGDYPTSGTTD